MKKFTSWEEVFENMDEAEQAEARRAYDDEVSGEKIIADVEAYFADFVGENMENCYKEEVPDVQGGLPLYTVKNFLWALS